MRTKISLIAIAAFLFSSLCNAQDNDKKMSFGLKVAPTIAWIKSDTKSVEGDGSRLGFAYGLITDFNFSSNYAFGTGVDVTYRGGKTKNKYVDSLSFDKNSFALQYIELPITLKLKTNEIGYITYFGRFGFAPGINIRAKADVENTATGAGEDDLGAKKGINPINLSFLVGLGATYSLGGSTSVLVGITFNNGFLDIFDKDYQAPDETGEYKDVKATSSFLALEVGIMF